MDLRSYIAQLDGPDAAWLSSELASRLPALVSAAEDEAAAAAATDGRPSSEAADVLRRRVCALQLQEELGGDHSSSSSSSSSSTSSSKTKAAAAAAAAAAASEGDAASSSPHVRRASEMMELFSDSLPLSKDIDERSRGPADELLALSAAALMRRHRGGGGAKAGGAAPDLAPLLQALVVLEAGVCGRPFSADCRLGLTALYGLLGCAGAAAGHFAKTDVKHIQLDTLASHHLLPLALALGADKVRRLGAKHFGGQLIRYMKALFACKPQPLHHSHMHAPPSHPARSPPPC
jgi:N-terminal acetyltransferase B complex non-catalytic subunit